MEYKLINCKNATYLASKLEFQIGNFLFKDKNRKLFVVNGERHMEDGPAMIDYFPGKDKCVYIEAYFIKNKLSRENGPAYITYNENGEIKNIEYWLEGIKYSEKKYLQQIETKLYW